MYSKIKKNLNKNELPLVCCMNYTVKTSLINKRIRTEDYTLKHPGVQNQMSTLSYPRK